MSSVTKMARNLPEFRKAKPALRLVLLNSAAPCSNGLTVEDSVSSGTMTDIRYQIEWVMISRCKPEPEAILTVFCCSEMTTLRIRFFSACRSIT